MAATTIRTVEPFDSSLHDWEQYAEMLDQYFIANKIAEAAQNTTVFLGVKTTDC